jgi:SWIM zinc finger
MSMSWDFSSTAENSTTSQINRQKSARNLTVQSLDKANPRATFYDSKLKLLITTELTACSCRDFNYVGKSPRSQFKPCMHIYRLAMEIGLIEATYEDYRLKAKVKAHGIAGRKDLEDAVLRSLPANPDSWGNWDSHIHESGLQKNRQYRAYDIQDDSAICEKDSMNGWAINSYPCSLSRCECADFRDRRLPCKHVYVVALLGKIALPLTRPEFLAAKAKGLKVIFRFEDL